MLQPPVKTCIELISPDVVDAKHAGTQLAHALEQRHCFRSGSKSVQKFLRDRAPYLGSDWLSIQSERKFDENSQKALQICHRIRKYSYDLSCRTLLG